MMKWIPAFALCFSGMLLSAGEAFFPLFQDGKAAAEIVVVPEAETHVAAFNRALKRCGGAELALRRGERRPGVPSIVFEITEKPIDRDDAFSIVFPDPLTLKIIASPRSVRWALNAILEQYAGVVFCFPGERGAHYPRSTDIRIPVRGFRDDADLKLSRFFTREDREWLLNMNGKELGRIDFVIGHNVGLTVLPPSKYACARWREKIMPLRNGKRLASPPRDTHGWQPCYSSPDAVSEAVKNISAFLAGHPGTKFFSISANDIGGYCECSACVRANGGVRKNRYNRRLRNWSDVYFKWCNAVVSEVSGKFPEVYFGTLAYSETSEPPSFKLHDRIVVAIPTDLHALMKKGRMEEVRSIYEAWSGKAANLGIWEYGFAAGDYSIPRLPWKLYSAGLRMLKANRGGFFFCESAPLTGEGPKRWLYLKMAWDVDADPDRLLRIWCAACVGEKAGRLLERYYRWTHDFWTSEQVNRTPWARTAGLYFARGLTESYLLALGKEDLAGCRRLMEAMFEEAKRSGDPDQRYRAERLLRFYDFHECMALLGGGGLVPLDSSKRLPPDALMNLRSAGEVCALLDAMPGILRRLARLPEIIAELNRDGFSGTLESRRIPVGRNIPGVFLNPVFRWRRDPSVRAAIRKTAENPELPAGARRQLSDILRFEKLPELIAPADDAEELALWDITRPGMLVELDHSTGKRRIKVTKQSGWAAVRRKIPEADPYHSYAVELTVSAPPENVAGNANSRLILCSSPNFDYTTRSSHSTEFYPQFPGKKVKMSIAATFPGDVYGGYFYVIWNGLEQGRHFFIEDIHVRELGGDPPCEEHSVAGWRTDGRKEGVVRTPDGIAVRNIAGITPLVSETEFPVCPGTRFRIVAPVKGKGVFRIGIAAFDGNGRHLGNLHGRLIQANLADRSRNAKWEETLPSAGRFREVRRIAVRLEMRRGGMEFGPVRILFFKAEKSNGEVPE